MSAPRRLLAAGTALGALAVAVWLPSAARGQQESTAREPRLSIFFSPQAALTAEAVGRIKKALAANKQLQLRPVLLVEDFKQLEAAPSADFRTTVNSLREIVGPEFGLQLYDEQGLEMAARLGIARLPAIVVEHGRRVHVAYGANPDIAALLRCAK